jgi:hypothetical protein
MQHIQPGKGRRPERISSIAGEQRRCQASATRVHGSKPNGQPPESSQLAKVYQGAGFSKRPIHSFPTRAVPPFASSAIAFTLGATTRLVPR